MSPDEHVRSGLRRLLRQRPVLASEGFDEGVDTATTGFASDRALVRRFFGHPDVTHVEAALHR